MIGVAMAPSRLRAIRGALRGKLLNGLITNELMAERLLK
jgi:DNA-binding transcriptional regulator LsrR (DeoR family)